MGRRIVAIGVGWIGWRQTVCIGLHRLRWLTHILSRRWGIRVGRMLRILLAAVSTLCDVLGCEGEGLSYRVVMRRWRVSTMLLTGPLAGRRIRSRCAWIGRRVLPLTLLFGSRRRVVATFIPGWSSLR